MRIAQIVAPWFRVPPDAYGGTERVVAELADGLSKRGHDVVLFAAPGSRSRAEVVTPLDEPPPPGAFGEQWYELAHVLEAYRRGDEFDVVHDHSGIIGASIASFSSLPVVHTVHTAFTPDFARIYSLLGPRLPLVAVSASQRASAPEGLRWLGVVHNGIPVERYQVSTQKQDYLVFMGRANRGKAPELAIEAARRSGRRLLLRAQTGDEFERRYWEEHVAPLVGDGVEVVGDLGDAEKSDLLGHAAALLFPIQWDEPFGLVMIEAMACGTPVIAWRNGSVSEVVQAGETGFVVDTLDDMVLAIGRLGELDGAKCRAHVEANFSSDRMVERYEETFARVSRTEERAHP
jgi:glycosyltransferase involved in cell wall biosynthesis